MVEVTERVLEFAKEAFRDLVTDLLDDPYGFASGEPENGRPTAKHVQACVQNCRQLAKDLQIDFDALMQEVGTPNEINRLNTIMVSDMA